MSQPTAHYPIDTTQIPNQISGSRRFGPLEVIYHIDIAKKQITITKTLQNMPIGNGIITPEQRVDQIIGGSGFEKVCGEIIGDFNEKRATFNIKIESWGNQIYNGKGTLFTW